MKFTRIRNRLLVVAALLGVASCELSTPTAIGPPNGAPDAELLGGWLGNLTLLSCNPLPADTTIATIDALGGTILVGPHRLEIPAGALTGPVEITAIAPSGTTNRVRFEPEGLTFDEPASLEMSYANCTGLPWWLPRRIVYLDDNSNILEVLLSFTHFGQQSVEGRVEHFSEYAVAW